MAIEDISSSLLSIGHADSQAIICQDYGALRAYIQILCTQRGYHIGYSGYGQGDYAVYRLGTSEKGTKQLKRGPFADCAYFALSSDSIDDGMDAFDTEEGTSDPV
jgi:hypothetical protein